MGEAQKVVVRNARRDANKLIDAEKKGATISEDDATGAKDDIQKLTKQLESQVDEAVAAKRQELESL